MARGVFERPKDSGIWWIRYTDQYGKLHREKSGSKSLAISAYRKRKTQIREGKFFPEMIFVKRGVLFKDMAKMFLEEYAMVNKLSWQSDEQRLEKCKEFFGDTPLSQIKKRDVERFRTVLLNEFSEATANRYIALLKTLFNKAMEWNKCDHNPAMGIKLFKEQHRVRFLSDEEEKNLNAKVNPQYWLWIEIALHTGMRRSEQFSLMWDNINFQTRTITIPRSKSGETRHIPMNDKVMEILRSLPSRMRSPWVFTSRNGDTPMDSRNFVQRVFLKAIKDAKIQDFRWHDLRHTFASRLVMAGVDLRTVQDLMGHKTITMTLKYSHLSKEHQIDAVQRLIQKPTDTATDTKERECLKTVPPARIELATPGLGIQNDEE